LAQQEVNRLSVTLKLNESMVEELRRKMVEDMDQSEDLVNQTVKDLNHQLNEAKKDISTHLKVIAQNKLNLDRAVEDSLTLRADLQAAHDKTR
jgi:FMN-dependent NADH-azoreductase